MGEWEGRRERGRHVPGDKDREAPVIHGRVEGKTIGQERGDAIPGAIAEPGIGLKESLTRHWPPGLGGEWEDDEFGKGQVARSAQCP